MQKEKKDDIVDLEGTAEGVADLTGNVEQINKL